MVIPEPLRREMIEHARAGAPEEVCGILATTDGEAKKLFRVTNAEHSPRFYVMDSQEQLQALMEIDHLSLEAGAVYHSHPASEPRPSPTDIELAKWPGTVFVIVSLANPQEPEIRGWRIEDGVVSEEPLETTAG